MDGSTADAIYSFHFPSVLDQPVCWIILARILADSSLFMVHPLFTVSQSSLPPLTTPSPHPLHLRFWPTPARFGLIGGGHQPCRHVAPRQRRGAHAAAADDPRPDGLQVRGHRALVASAHRFVAQPLDCVREHATPRTATRCAHSILECRALIACFVFRAVVLYLSSVSRLHLGQSDERSRASGACATISKATVCSLAMCPGADTATVAADVCFLLAPPSHRC